MKFEALEKWLESWKNSRLDYLDRLRAAYTKWDGLYCAAHNDRQNRKPVEVREWSTVKGYYTKVINAVTVVIDGKEYLEYGYNHDGYTAYLKDNGFNGVSQQDEQLIKYYTREEQLHRVEKEVQHKRKSIIAKVQKICTDEVTEVAEIADDGLFIRGVNGKVAHMWAVFAGGYNVQCLHIRVLVKESKWLEK